MKRKVLFGILPIVLMCACGAPKVTESVLPETSVSETSTDDAILSEEISEEVSPSTEDDSKEKLIPLHSATVEALEASKVYTYQDLYSDEVDSDYFFVGNFDGSDAELYALTNYVGYIVRVGNDLYPIEVSVDINEPHYMIADDFDKDGETEYGFTVCDGRGTSFFTEKLVIADPGEKEKTAIFGIDDLKVKNGDFFECVKTEIDEENHAFDYHLEIDGRISDKGRVELTQDLSDDYKLEGLYFGDIFYIYYTGDMWSFDANGGTVWSDIAVPQYTDSVHMISKLIYKDGEITFSKTGGVRLVPEWAYAFGNEKTGPLEYGGFVEDFYLYGSGGYYYYSDSFVVPDHMEGTPKGRISLGGAGKCINPTPSEPGAHEIFEDGKLVECTWWDNHSGPEKIADFTYGDYSYVMYKNTFDLFVGPEVDEVPVGTPLTSSYWVIFYTKGEGETLYFKFFNCDYFTEEEAKDSVKY